MSPTHPPIKGRHRRTARYALVTTALTLLLAGCGSQDVDPDALPDVPEATEDATAEAEEALANLRVEAQETVEEVRTGAAPEVKQELLDRCCEAVKVLRDAESDATSSVEDICTRIETTEVSDAELWSDIKREIDNVRMT